MQSFVSRLVVLFSLLLVLLPTASMAASSDGSVAVTQSSMLKITKGMSPAVLAARPDSESVQLPSGRTIKLGSLRRLSSLSQKLKMSTGKPQPAALSFQPAATGIKVRNGNDLSAVLERPDSETVELPSGKRVTVGLLRYLQPEVERRLGSKLANAGTRPVSTGPVIKIKKSTDQEYWKEILQKPDSTVLEAPDGQRITVGELKLSLGSPPSAATPKR